ncbi:AIM24 family protein [Prauserella rugosa]|uniref:Uncharacterized protein (AIM24 family) n=1 Tax=Prauserella rugosa TaxID=43354 RepID=A0A660CBR6_9PSEU|nr:AIM24 family protein [Prauserella rugosa]KMS88968.1 hypothetical protein ACZ91_22925 [Streptomyces regensis]TWH21030.1 uncharacterized protein (AIM24 family) [Prauserella rugosa]
MEVHTRHTPTFGVARIVLAEGESVQAPDEAVMASAFGISVSRGPRGEHPVLTAPAGGGWVDLAPDTPGDVYPLGFDGRSGWCVSKVPASRVLARPASIRRDEQWPALQSLFGGTAGFLEHYSGTGSLVLSARGPVDLLNLDAGEMITVRPDFLVAYPDTIQVRLRALDPAAPQSVRTGEGLALDFAGPGTVLLQARR